MGCGCGKRGTTTSYAGGQVPASSYATPRSLPADRSTPAARRGVTAAARVVYLVRKADQQTGGRRFSTLGAAQDYARATGGTVVPA